MTESKRYVRILDYSEKEVRIFDKNNQKNIFNIFFEGIDSAICLKGALEDTVDLLNELTDEIKKLRTLNYVNKEAVRLNCIKTVQIGNNDVDCSNIDWELLYELYGAMIDYYYEGDMND